MIGCVRPAVSIWFRLGSFDFVFFVKKTNDWFGVSLYVLQSCRTALVAQWVWQTNITSDDRIVSIFDGRFLCSAAQLP